MTSHVSEGTRVYLPSIDMFGDVTATNALGGKAARVMCDDGVLRLFCGEDTVTEVVNSVSKLDGKGTSRDVAPDVKDVGPAVLSSFGVDEETQASLFQKFLTLEKNVRQEKLAFWEANKEDSTAMSTFIPELLELLRDDEVFIKEKSKTILRHVDESIRDKMLTNMLTNVSEEDRKSLILHFTGIQNDKIKRDEFLQNMYELLLDDVDYIKMEFQNALQKYKVDQQEAETLISNYIAGTTAEEQEQVVNNWRRAKYYRSVKGPKYAYDLLSSHEMP